MYWRNCIIGVYEAGNTKDPVDTYANYDGQGVVETGIVLWIGGKDGQVKAEKSIT